jgi:hypothetical protein
VNKTYTLKSKVTVYPGMAAWRFLGLPFKEAKEIKEAHGKRAKGWGSLPVSVTIGNTAWETSIFPDKKSGTYVLPLKGKIRKAEGISDTDTVTFQLKVR